MTIVQHVGGTSNRVIGAIRRYATGQVTVSRRTKLLLFVTSLVALTFVASACELRLQGDCSWINQPDMGGLVCLGVNVLGAAASLIALLLALVIGIGSAIPQ